MYFLSHTILWIILIKRDKELIEDKAESGKFNFSVDSSLLFQLGEQLVARPSIALAELVKNAYDADAAEVTIRMENVEEKGGTIIVEDDGHGMTFEEMKVNWMRIATNTKRKKPSSKIYHRPLTGAKGIGRFAARRLGNKLTIQSIALKRNGTKESTVAEFNWKSKDFQPGKNLVKIPVSYTRQPVSLDSETGVTLFIEDARDAWSEEDISELRRDLLSIQSPFPDLVVSSELATTRTKYLPDPGFNIKFEIVGSGELEDLSGGLGEAFLAAAWARLDGRIDKKGNARYDLNIQSTGEKDTLFDSSHDYTGLENARLRIYYMVYNKKYFEGFDFGVRDVRNKGRAEGGVRIYLDGFRVFPYGDPGNDWLQLDEFAARNIDLATDIAPPEKVMELATATPGRPYLLLPRNYQLFGVVSLSQTVHSGVEINVSRERLIESPTEARLRSFVLNGIYWMTIKYGAYLAEERAKERKKKAPQTVSDIIGEARVAIAQLEIPEDRRQEVIWNLDRAIERAQETEEERISEISMLRILASAGTTLLLMNHQLRALISAVLQIREDLLRLRPEIPVAHYERYDDIVAQVSEWYDLVTQQVSQLGFLLSTDSRQRRKRHPLHKLVENVGQPMSYYIKMNKVDFKNLVPQNLRTPPIYQSELYSILINILSNALKAVYGQPVRCIAVKARIINRNLHIYMMDTGVGLPAAWKESSDIAFKPFETRSIPNPILGVGTGLGLKVVKDIIELYGGTARFIKVDKPWSTCIEIVLPERN